MSDARDIAQNGAALCFAALSLTFAPAAAVAALAVPAATLAAIGWTLRQKCGRRACERAAGQALGLIEASPEHKPEDLARAASLLKDSQRALDLAPAEWRAAARSDDFDGHLAGRLTDSRAEEGDLHCARSSRLSSAPPSPPAAGTPTSTAT